MFIFRVSFRDMLNTLYELEMWQLLVLLLVFGINSGTQISSRKFLLHVLNAKCGYKNLVYIHFSTLAAHYTTPAKIGFPLAIFLLNKFEKVPYSIGTSMIFIELAIGTGLCAVIAFINFPVSVNVSTAQLLGIISIFAVTGMIIFKITGRLVKLQGYLFNIISSLRNLRRRDLFIYVLFAVGLRFLDGINLYLLSIYFSETLTIWQAIVSTSTAFFVGAVSMIPMGLGTRDASLLFYLQHYNMGDSTAIVIITLQRMLSTGLGFLLGIIFGFILGIKNVLHREATSDNNSTGLE